MKKVITYLASLLLLAASAFAQAQPSPFPPDPPSAGYTLVPAFPSLTWVGDRPVGLATNTGRLFVWSRPGRVYVITNTAAPTKTLFLSISNVLTTGDSGFPGFAFHPNGQSVFTWANETNATRPNLNRLRKWTVNPTNANAVLPQSEILIEQVDDEHLHSGGALAFGPDGYLYGSWGDEGLQNGALGNTQKIDRDFFSSIMRIDVDGRPGNLPPNPHPAVVGQYWVPADNPWIGATNFNGQAVDPTKVRTEFWAIGFRNPHTMKFDGTNLYVGDVGNVRWEEVNRVVRGGNYGWNWVEGNEQTTFKESPQPPSSRPPVAFDAPLWTYPHAGITTQPPRMTGNCVMIGGVYRGTKYPRLNGKILVADYVSLNLWALDPSGSVEWVGSSPNSVCGFQVDPVSGDILCISHGAGTVTKLVETPPANVPATLSATGLFTDLSSMTPAPGVLPYEVAAPFWSDYAIKTRWVKLPAGTSITRNGENWVFPTGTIWVKNFLLPSIRTDSPEAPSYRLETRVTVKTTGGLYGLTYRWRAVEHEADLVGEAGDYGSYLVEGTDAQVFSQPWHFPARSECATCHNPEAGFVLGFSTRQLNVPVAVEGGGTVNQLLGMSALGLFNPPFATVDGLPRLSRPLDETATLEHRFKSYTDANCGYCHLPNGPGRGEWDARFSVPLAESSIVKGSVLSDLGFPGSSIIHPGDTNRSILFHRVADMDAHQVPAEYHMPPLATYQRNEAGVTMLEQFINSLERKSWRVGTNSFQQPTCAVEFTPENRTNDLAPGTLGLDDDFYTAGTYQAGFNGLTNQLVVAQDEPWSNWERANTHRDRQNRLHFATHNPGPATVYVRWGSGGWMLNNVTQSGFSTHNMAIDHVFGGVTNRIWTGTITRATEVTVPFTAGEGANSILISRLGPEDPNTSYWLVYDSVLVSK